MSGPHSPSCGLLEPKQRCRLSTKVQYLGSKPHQGLSCPRVSFLEVLSRRATAKVGLFCTIVDVAWGHLGSSARCRVMTGSPPHFHPRIRFIYSPLLSERSVLLRANVNLPFTTWTPGGRFQILAFTEWVFFCFCFVFGT